MQPPPRQRTAEEERARAAARQAEKELWERTRGAGSAVFTLAESGRIKPRSRSGTESRGASGEGGPSNLTAATDAEQLVVPHKGGGGGGQADAWTAEDVLPTLKEVESKLYEPVHVHSADILLSRGICDYTLLPKTLGRGKFSTVFVASSRGQLHAIKHTALFPHHQLIATRLLREPTLLAELPPHPNLVSVKETIRTPGHFYLVEEYLDGYLTLEALLPMLNPTPPHVLPTEAAERILSQLISAVHAIHVPLQICHRDIKPENILVHPQTLQLKLLDFGLATHFSKSEPKLSTCCGSPAFHCPEIVKALANPPGTVMYMGPEVDAWTCGVTMLRCLTGARFPLGASHSSVRGMSIRAQRAVATITDSGLRDKVGALLDVDGKRRMKRFDEMVEEEERSQGGLDRGVKKFKSTTFIPSTPTHYINLPLLDPLDEIDGLGGYASMSASRRTTPSNSRAPSPSRYALSNAASGSPSSGVKLTALNPNNHPPERIVSFVKYCLRCAGILHHTWADVSGLTKPVKHHDFFSSHPSQPTTGVSSAFAEAVGSPLDAITTPSTPLFPPTYAGHEDRVDGLAHVQVFQCVIEFPEEKEQASGGLSGQLGQLSLVQSIMAAFSRKSPASPTPDGGGGRPDNRPSGNGKASSPSPGPRAQGKRSLSTPALPRTAQLNAAKNASALSVASKDGTIRCLAFHLIVKFPNQQPQPPQSYVRQAMSRATSYLGTAGSTSEYQQQAISRANRSRASSAAGALTNEMLTSSATGVAANTIAESETRSRETSPTVELRRQVKIKDEDDGGNATHLGSNGAHAVHHTARSNVSPSPSRPQSRTRKRSSRGPPRRPRVYFYVSDERAAAAVRDALSIGGTVDVQEMEEPRRPHATSTPSMLGPEHNAGHGDLALGETASAPGSRRGGKRRTRDSVRNLQLDAWPNNKDGDSGAEGGSGHVTPVNKDDSDPEPRGRSLTSSRIRNSSNDTVTGADAAIAATSSARAPSQLSTVALKEESPSTHDLSQTIEALSSTLSEVVRSTPRSSANASPPSQSALASPQTRLTTLAGDETPTYDGRQSGMLTQTRALLMDILRALHKAERQGAAALEEVISPVSFALFAALSPALGLIPTEVLGLPASSTAPKEAGEGATTLRGLTMSALELVARNASPREIFIAAQERLEVLASFEGPSQAGSNSSASQSPTSSSSADKLQSLDVIGPNEQLQVRIPHGRTSKGKARSQPWNAALEVAGLLHILSIVLPRIKTQKPSSFIEPLVGLVPRVAFAVLQADIRCRLKARPIAMTPFSPSPIALDAFDETGAGGVEKVADDEQHRAGTCEIILSMLNLCRGIAQWSEALGGTTSEDAPLRDHLLMLFYSSLIALLPEMPKPSNEVYLSDLALRQFAPQYDVVDLGPNPSRSTKPSPSVDTALSAQVWKQIRDTTKALSIDFESQALEQASPISRKPGDTTTKAATRTMGAFILLVNLLARSDHGSGTSLNFPQWEAGEALLKMQRSLGLLTACLGSGGLPATISKDGLQSFGGANHLPDAALTYATWCVAALRAAPVEMAAEDAIMFVNTLASYAATCPRPHARHLSLLLVQDSLRYLSDRATARDIILDIVRESPYPQLRSAVVGIARTLISSELDEVKAEQMLTSDASFTQALSQVLFVVPGEPDAHTSSAIAIRGYLDENGAWLSEVLAFVYLVVTRDHEDNRTGLCTPERLRSMDEDLLGPLSSYIASSQEPANRVGESDSERTEIDLALSLLSVSLDRAQGAVTSALQRTATV